MEFDSDRCWQAIEARDARFDGWVFCGVTSTGIYCRPSCPARTPKRENVRFFATAAGAQAAGFRACKRCRPDATPGSPEWDRRADLVGRAMRLIADGVVDREGVAGLARRLGYSRAPRPPPARRGASAWARSRSPGRSARRPRACCSRRPMLRDRRRSRSPPGFSSVRQFNATIQEVFAVTPERAARRARGPGRASQRRQRDHAATALPGAARRRRAGRVPRPARRGRRRGGRRRRLPAQPAPAARRREWSSCVRGGSRRSRALLARRPARPRRGRTAVARDCSISTPIRQAVVEALGSDELLGALVRAAPGRRVARSRRWPRAGRARGARSAGFDRRRDDARRSARRGVRRAAARGRVGGVTHLFPRRGRWSRRTRTAGDAAPRDAVRCRPWRARSRAGELVLDAGAERERGAAAAAGAAGHRTLDRLVHRDARAPRPGRVPGRRSRRPPRAGAASGRRATGGRRAAGRALAPVPRLRASQHLWAHLGATMPAPGRRARRPTGRRRRSRHDASSRRGAAGLDALLHDREPDRRAAAARRRRVAARPLHAGGAQAGAHRPALGARPAALAPAREQLAEYFARRANRVRIALRRAGSAFQRRVWGALREIPYGETTSYGELARRIGRPASPRAVGLANGSNPIPIIVPCHRRDRRRRKPDRAIGGGVTRKRLLLELEARVAGAPGVQTALADV